MTDDTYKRKAGGNDQSPNTRQNGRDGRPERGRRPPERDAPREDKEGAEGRFASKRRPFQDSGRAEPGDRPRGAAGALIELDRDLMKMLVRRATLVSRIRGGRDHASTPAAIQAEKAVRMAWESGALAFSKDPRFTRQLFNLLQDLKVMSKEQAESMDSYNLSPPARPVSGAISGPTSARVAQMRIALAACLGAPLTLNHVTLSAALADTIKACNQAGGKVSYEHQGALAKITVEQGSALVFSDKTLYAGEDLFTLYLMSFLAAGKTGISRFTGGSRLKSADLSPLRHALPLFGARLAHVIPRSQGLPANVESSGAIPPAVLAPADMPFEGVCALLISPLVWQEPVTLDLAALPASVATAALEAVRPLHREMNADVETKGSKLQFAPAPLSLQNAPELPIDPVLAAYLLAIPAFAGGELRLNGSWPSHMPGALEVEQLFAWAGMAIESGADHITARIKDGAQNLPLQCSELSPALGPLYLTLMARKCLASSAGHNAAGHFPTPLFPVEEADAELAQDFLARLGVAWTADKGVSSSEKQDDGSDPAQAAVRFPAWASPDAFWSMAYALGAYLRPGLRLANPGNVNEAMPTFWGIYNSLPAPSDPAVEPGKKNQEEVAGDKPARRRIIAE